MKINILVATKYWWRQNIGADKTLTATKYWHRQKCSCWQKLLASTKCWHLQNVGVNKVLVSTNVAVDKILVSTKYLHWQNVGVDKILTSTKSLRQQNAGIDKMLAQAQKYLLTFWLGRVCSSWLLPDLAGVLLLPWRCWSLHCSRQVCFGCTAAWLKWAHSAPYGLDWLYRSAMPKMSQRFASTKYWRPPRFRWFSSNCSSLYLCS
jgi:hypothetical protein